MLLAKWRSRCETLGNATSGDRLLARELSSMSLSRGRVRGFDPGASFGFDLRVEGSEEIVSRRSWPFRADSWSRGETNRERDFPARSVANVYRAVLVLDDRSFLLRKRAARTDSSSKESWIRNDSSRVEPEFASRSVRDYERSRCPAKKPETFQEPRTIGESIVRTVRAAFPRTEEKDSRANLRGNERRRMRRW